MKENNGFSLTELVIAIGIVGIIAIGGIHFSKQTISMGVDSKNAIDLASLRSELTSIYNSEAHCNANLKGLAIGTIAAANIYRCELSTDDCVSTGIHRVKFPITNSSWDQTSTNISNRMRLSSLSYVVPNQPSGYTLTSVSAQFSIEKKDSNKTSMIPISIVIPVIMNNGVVIACNRPGLTVINCSGSWESCSSACGAGTETFTINRDSNAYGEPCAYSDGETRACTGTICPVDCVGSWGACNSCVQTFSITTPAENGGVACLYTDGATQACCTPINCAGSWGTCNSSTGLQTYTITTPASGGGTACPYANGATQACAVNGGWSAWSAWSACTGGTCPTKSGTRTQTRTCTNPTPKNGGAACSGASSQSQSCTNTTLNCGYSCTCSGCSGPSQFSSTNITGTSCCTIGCVCGGAVGGGCGSACWSCIAL